MRFFNAIAVGTIGLSLACLPPAFALTPSNVLLGCQKKLETQARVYAKLVAKKVHVCTDKVAACKLADEIDAVDPTNCLAAATTKCAGVDALLDANRTRRKTSIDSRCALIPLADVEPFLGGLGFLMKPAACAGAVTTTALTDCLLDESRCTAEREVFRRDPRAQDSLTAVGVAASFPCVAP